MKSVDIINILLKWMAFAGRSQQYKSNFDWGEKLYNH